MQKKYQGKSEPLACALCRDDEMRFSFFFFFFFFLFCFVFCFLWFYSLEHIINVLVKTENIPEKS